MKDEIAQKLEEKTTCDYDKIAFSFASTRQIIWKDISLLTKYVKNGDTLLDYGCGNGRLVQIFADKEISYLGVDPCSEFIKLAEKEYGSDTVKFAEIGQESKNVPYDVIFSIAVIHHIPSKKKQREFIAQLHSLLKPGGILIISSWNLWQKRYRPYVLEYMRKKLFCQTLDKEIDKKAKGCDLDWFDTFIPFQDFDVYRYVHAFTKRSLAKLLKGAGFEIIDAYYSEEEKKVSLFQGKNIIIVSKKNKV